MFAFSSRSAERMAGVDPRLIEVAYEALKISRIDFGIPDDGGIRTAERQRELFDSGKSKADGTEKTSYHQSGKALDVYAYVDGKASWDMAHLSLVACAMLQAANVLGYQVAWGGLWSSFIDAPHFQITESFA